LQLTGIGEAISKHLLKELLAHPSSKHLLKELLAHPSSKHLSLAHPSLQGSKISFDLGNPWCLFTNIEK
jgi:hypothetical protein